MALMRAREAVMREFRPLLAAHDLTEQQWRVLRALAELGEPLEVGELAAVTNLLGPSLSRMLVALDGRGLVSRSKVRHDGRRSAVGITADGRRLVARLGPDSEQRYEAIEAYLGSDRLALLEELLADLAKLASEGDQVSSA